MKETPGSLSEENRRRAAVREAGLALAWLAAGVFAGALVSGQILRVACVVIGLAGYLHRGARAMRLIELREASGPGSAFGIAARRTAPPRAVARPARTRAVALGPILLLGLAAGTADAQQTIFNVPSADVLDPGKVYLEVDELFRPTAPRFSSTTVRGVVGVFPRVEAGVNFGGLVSPGPVVPTATLAVKGQPVRAGNFAL